MDIGRSFSYVFEDKDWPKKLIIGGLINFVPILNFANMGYALRVLRTSARGQEPTLPEWDQLGQDWVKGLLQTLALAILLLPLIPGIIASGVAGEWMDSGDGNPLVLCCFGLTCLTSLWGLFVAIIYPMARAHYALSDEFAAFFRFRTLLKAIGQRLGDYVVVLLMIIVAQMLAGTIGSLVCIVGVAFTSFYAELVTADLIGQVAADSALPPTFGEPRAPRPAPTAAYGSAEDIEAELNQQIESGGDVELLGDSGAADDQDYGGPEA
ncbi:MAG: DUF4013 domain-containing protein [Chloroflexi bacterium]|nr:DUF4013 domain-containing protein [Chloroflexota bacterium]